jgi:flagella basal body P-ring formation protein FlgA
MFKNLSVLILILFSPVLVAGESCFINTYPNLWTIDGTAPSEVSSAIKKSNCSPKVRLSFLHFILTRKGSIHSSIIESSLKKDLKTEVIIKPRKLKIGSLNESLKDKFSTSQDWFFKDIKLTSKKKILTLDKSSRLILNCNQCEFAGEKNIKFIIQNPLNNTNKQEWAQTKIKVRVEALTAASDFNVTNTALSKNMFSKKYVYVATPEKLFTNFKGLAFYKLNKPLRRGQVLNFSDLSSVDLVKAGRPTNISLKNNNLNISSKAMPMRSGKFGEIIQLRHLVTRKIIIGKIVDFNKVVVEL